MTSFWTILRLFFTGFGLGLAYFWQGSGINDQVQKWSKIGHFWSFLGACTLGHFWRDLEQVRGFDLDQDRFWGGKNGDFQGICRSHGSNSALFSDSDRIRAGEAKFFTFSKWKIWLLLAFSRRRFLKKVESDRAFVQLSSLAWGFLDGWTNSLCVHHEHDGLFRSKSTFLLSRAKKVKIYFAVSQFSQK